ncbi:DUF4367 domain-containing protein [Anaerostipes sp.]|uniref:DUF4367 domain-containing protein n=1 Tax=Anaerostipes sp. TaxID=1872530 RepID=UPI0025845C9D|nr:DUF4367 domain-containing protein [Anaerostipes sp.]MCI5623659.1 DUF4367 domain-containing protein [Anaerostipes sp.]
MSKNMNKKIEDQDKLLDHIIEYGGKQYIDDEIEEFDQIPELELSDEFNQRMDKMFKNAYKKEARKERMHLARRVAAIAIVVLGIVSVTAMNVKAFREPVLNFIFKKNNENNKTTVHISNSKKNPYKFEYIPTDYRCSKIHFSNGNEQIIYTFVSKEKKYLIIKIQINTIYDNYIKQTSSDYEKIYHNKKEFFFLDGSQNSLIFYKNKTIFSIISVESQSEMIKIAEGIKLNN